MITSTLIHILNTALLKFLWVNDTNYYFLNWIFNYMPWVLLGTLNQVTLKYVIENTK